jgi:D-beta-D-heptose 7-phosphate kinase/D-beta-D-heptose 1-phosphate adenosyltransferase
MTLFEPGTPPLHIPSAARDVFDVTGAGDTVAGTLALALAAGAPLAVAAQLANRAAGIVVGKFGTAQATAAELRSAVNKAT